MIPQIPLELIYRYDPTRGDYVKVGTHHRITIEQFEGLERIRARASKSMMKIGVAGVCITVTFMVVVLIAAVIGTLYP